MIGCPAGEAVQPVGGMLCEWAAAMMEQGGEKKQVLPAINPPLVLIPLNLFCTSALSTNSTTTVHFYHPFSQRSPCSFC
jgi:hypothetical protein